MATASCSIRPPLRRPNAMPALITPEKTATVIPFLKSNSATVFFFSSSGSSRSFDMPAMPTMTMPASAIRTPASVACPEPVANRPPSSPRKAGGISVPADAQRPLPTARPSPTPR